MESYLIRKTFNCCLFVIFLTTTIISCKNKDDSTPDYVGAWLTEKEIPGATGFHSVIYSLNLSENTFIETFLTGIYRITPTYQGTFVTISGSIFVSENKMTFIPAKIAFSVYNASTSTASEPHEIITTKDSHFKSTMDSFVLPTCNYKSEFIISENELIIKADYNNDGIISEKEKLVYTRQ